MKMASNIEVITRVVIRSVVGYHIITGFHCCL